MSCLEDTGLPEPSPCLEVTAIPEPPPSRPSSASSNHSRHSARESGAETLSQRYRSALKNENPIFNLDGLADWLSQVPERLGADDLLDKAALAFLDALDFVQRDSGVALPRMAFEATMNCFESALQGQDQGSSPHWLAAAFMLTIVLVSAPSKGVCHFYFHNNTQMFRNGQKSQANVICTI